MLSNGKGKRQWRRKLQPELPFRRGLLRENGWGTLKERRETWRIRNYDSRL